MAFIPDVGTNLVADLAAALIERTLSRLRAAAFGDAEQQALQHAWEAAFAVALEEVAADLDRDQAHLLDDVLRQFVAADGVADALLDLALEGRDPPLPLLRERFASLEWDAETLSVDFDALLAALTRALAAALLDAAGGPDSPLYNRVSVVRTAAIHQLLRDQGRSLAEVARQVTQLESTLGRDRYSVVFLGPVSGFAIGDRAEVRMAAPQRDLLDAVERLLGELTANRRPAPYTDADRDAYLDAVIDACAYITLPVPGGSGTGIPLERVYVALQADHASPAERQASQDFFQALVHQEMDRRPGGDYWQIYRQVLRFNPRAARWLQGDPRFAPLFARDEAEEAKTLYLAEIVRCHRWAVLLGDPGSGKTTLARWLALRMARALREGQTGEIIVPASHVRPDADPGQTESLGPARLPVLVRVADYAAERWPQPGEDTGLPLVNYLGRHLKEQRRPDRDERVLHALLRDYLHAGRVTFILDGLDEVTDPTQRREIAAQIEGLIDRHAHDAAGLTPLDPAYHPASVAWDDPPGAGGGCQVIVTSRPVGYQVQPLHARLPHFMIRPMDDVAVRRFCAAWAEARGMAGQTEALHKAVLEHPVARVRDEMARNPLLLTVLAQVFENSKRQLPAQRAALYGRAAAAMFDQRKPAWERLAPDPRRPQDFIKAMTRITAHLAFRLHDKPDFPASLAEEDRVREWLEEALEEEPELRQDRRLDDVVDDVLHAARELSGFLVARGEGVYGFVHRQFQEYFAAQYLVAQADVKALFLARLGSPAWREVLLLAAALMRGRVAGDLLARCLDEADPTGGLLPHNLLFVAAALRELDRPDAALTRRVAGGLIHAYRRDDMNRFETMHERVERAFAALPRAMGRDDPVSAALCAALSLSPSQGEPALSSVEGGQGEGHSPSPSQGEGWGEGERLTRLAACELIVESEWYTGEVARALSASWQRHLEPAGTMLTALQQAYDAHPEHWAGWHVLTFRQRMEQDRALWAQVEQHDHWQAVLRALYLAPWADLTPAAIVRDSPLTPGLLALLARDPGDEGALRDDLYAQFAGAGELDGVARRDAGLALAYLGDERVVPALLVGDDQDGARAARAILAASALALARALDRARALDLDLALALARDLDRIDEIISLIEAAQARAPVGDAGQEVQTALTDALAKAHRLREMQAWESGVVDTWLAVGQRARDKPRSWAEWAGGRRPALDRAWLAQLADRFEIAVHTLPDGAALLPRLDGTPLAGLEGDEAAAARAMLEAWLKAGGENDPLPRHGALLLAEMGTIAPQVVPLLCACLCAVDDLTRYRAQIALHRERKASALGREVGKQMARCARCAGSDEACAARPCWRTGAVDASRFYLAYTYLGWALTEIDHDRPDWLRAWAEGGEAGVLGRIYRLSEAAWPAFLDLLVCGADKVRAALLESASWLLRLERVSQEQLDPLCAVLLAALDDEAETVRAAALVALGHWPGPDVAILDALLALAPSPLQGEGRGEGWGEGVYTALARLGARLDEDSQARARSALEAALRQPEGRAAWVRLTVGLAGKTDSPGLLSALLSAIPDRPSLLSALLRAGADDDGWSERYHQRIVAAIDELVQGDNLLGALLSTLREALDQDEWPPKRIALAAVAACAEAMPDALNAALPREALEALMVQSVQVADSFTARRQAVNTLSHLHTATPAAVEVLLTACQDVETVQKDAVAAAARFQHLSPEFGQEEALEALRMALSGESAAAAYVSARLLGALGSAPAAVEIEGLRERVIRILSEGLRDECAQRDVYLLNDRAIEYKGTLAQALFGALVQVAGLPE